MTDKVLISQFEKKHSKMQVSASKSVSSINNAESFTRLQKFNFIGPCFFVFMIIVPLFVTITGSLMTGFLNKMIARPKMSEEFSVDEVFTANASALRCHRDAYPHFNSYLKRYHCVCMPAFSGNGRTSCEPCGSIRKKHALRIVGGQEAVLASWPMAVYLEQTYKHTYLINGSLVFVNKKWGCGGVLINHRFVLTAAHCIRDVSLVYQLNFLPNNMGKMHLPMVWNNLYPNVESTISIYLGVHNIRGISSSRRVRAKRYIRYPSYCYPDRSNDVALIELDEHIKPNQKVGFSCLPPVSDGHYPGIVKNSIVIGWGKLSENDTTSDVLHNVEIEIIHPDRVKANEKSNKECSKFSSYICAGEMKGGKDSCLGDSGNGLYIRDANLTHLKNEIKMVVAGIVSFGVGCARPDSPGTYTRVSFYRDWILANSQY